MDDATGKETLVHDIAYGKYDVTLETGPSYATQRQEAADLQMELLKVLGPDRAANIVHLIVQNLGVPGSEEVARVLRKMLPEDLKTEEEKLADLPQGVTRDDDGNLVDEAGEPWQPPMTPEMQIQMKTNEIEELKAQAEMAKHQATTDKAAADTKQAEADLMEAQADLQRLQAGAGQEGQDQGADRDAMLSSITESIQTVMREHVEDPGAHDAMDIEEKIAAAIVEALKRVRGYVDRSVVDVGANDQTSPGTQLATRPATAVPQQVEPVVQEAPRPDRVRIVPAADGSMIAEPEYDNPVDAGPPQLTRLRIIPGEDGSMIAEPEYGKKTGTD
jgi:hypothetical protein